MEPHEMISNELAFERSLQEADISLKQLSAAKALLTPTPRFQVEAHARIFEILNFDQVLKEKKLESSPAAKIYRTVMRCYLENLDEITPRERWN